MRHIGIYALLTIATLCACGGKPELESVSATSTLADAHNRYKAANLIDGTASNWCEGSQGSGIGTEIRLRLKQAAKVSRLYVQNGFGDPRYFARNNRVAAFSIAVEGQTGSAPVNVDIKDTAVPQIVDFPALTGREFKLTIRGVHASGKDDDTCITELGFAPPQPRSAGAAADTVKATSAGKGCAVTETVIKVDSEPTTMPARVGDAFCKDTDECPVGTARTESSEYVRVEYHTGKSCAEVGFACEGFHQGEGKVMNRCR